MVPPPDKIIISGLRCWVNLGITEAERETKQLCTIDLEICCDLSSAGESDSLAATVDYSQVVDKVCELAESSSFNLIEALAERISDSILKNFNAEQVTVRISKLNPPLSRQVSSAAVEITRAASNCSDKRRQQSKAALA